MTDLELILTSSQELIQIVLLFYKYTNYIAYVYMSLFDILFYYKSCYRCRVSIDSTNCVFFQHVYEPNIERNYNDLDCMFLYQTIKRRRKSTYSHSITPFSSDRRKSFSYANFLHDMVYDCLRSEIR